VRLARCVGVVVQPQPVLLQRLSVCRRETGHPSHPIPKMRIRTLGPGLPWPASLLEYSSCKRRVLPSSSFHVSASTFWQPFV
jgi:hypothetical protein